MTDQDLNPKSKRSLVRLVADLPTLIVQLIKDEIESFKNELVSKLKQANIDVVYFGGYHTEAGLIIRQMRDQGLQTILMGGDALITQEFWSITGDAGEGTLMTFTPDPRERPDAAPVVQRLRAAAEIVDGDVEPLFLEVAEALADRQRKIVQRGLATDREGELLFLGRGTRCLAMRGTGE